MELPSILLGGMENLLWWFSLGLIIICVHGFLGEQKKKKEFLQVVLTSDRDNLSLEL